MDRVLDHLGMTDKYQHCEMCRADWNKYDEFLKAHGDEYPYVLDHDTEINEPHSDGCALLFLKDKFVSSSQKWGFINERGEEIISCNFDKLEDFNYGLAKYYDGELF